MILYQVEVMKRGPNGLADGFFTNHSSRKRALRAIGHHVISQAGKHGDFHYAINEIELR